MEINGNLASASIEGDFYTGWDREKINVDMTGDMELVGPDINIDGLINVLDVIQIVNIILSD